MDQCVYSEIILLLREMSTLLFFVADGKSDGLSSIQSLKVRENAYVRVRQVAKCILPLSDNLRAPIRVCIKCVTGDI